MAGTTSRPPAMLVSRHRHPVHHHAFAPVAAAALVVAALIAIDFEDGRVPVPVRVLGEQEWRTEVETSDNGYYVIVDEAGVETAAGSATTTSPADDTLSFSVRAVAGGGLLTVEVTLHNAASPPLELGAAGLLATVEVIRDGTPWRVLHVSDPDLTRLGAGVALTRQTTTRLAGAGQYAVTASVETRRR